MIRIVRTHIHHAEPEVGPGDVFARQQVWPCVHAYAGIGSWVSEQVSMHV